MPLRNRSLRRCRMPPTGKSLWISLNPTDPSTLRICSESSPAGLFDAFRSVPSDPALRAQTMAGIKELLLNKHKLGLDQADVETIDHVHEQFFRFGPQINYNTRAVRSSREFEEITYETL